MVVHAEVKQFNVIIWKIGQKKKKGEESAELLF